MPTYQATLFMGDSNETYGWSEPYYLTALDAPTAQTKLEDLINARIEVLVEFCSVIAGRVSDVNILNDSLLATNTPIPGQITATELSAADPWSALLCRIEATSLHRGRHFFHGVLENTFLPGRSFDPAGPDIAAWNTWGAFMQANTLLRYTVLGVPTYGAITNFIFQREVEKKVGRPFNQLHGRRVT